MFKSYQVMTGAAMAALLAAGCKSAEDYKEERLNSAALNYDVLVQKRLFAEDQVLTLQDCISLAMQNNADIRVYQKRKEAADAKVAAEAFAMLPDLTISNDFTSRNNVPASSSKNIVGGTGGTYSASQSSDENINGLNVELALSALDCGLAALNSAQAQDDSLIRDEETRRAIQNLVYDVVRNYYRVAATQDAIQTTEQYLERCKNAKEQLQQLADSGAIPVMRVLDEQKRFIQLEQSLKDYRRNYQSACYELGALMGVITSDIKVDSSAIAKLQDFYVPDIQLLEKIALTQRPELYQMDIQTNIAVNEARKTMLMMLPHVKAVVDFQNSNNSFLYHKNWWEIGVTAAYNFLKLPQKVALLRSQLAQEEEMAERTLALSIGIISQVRIAHANMLELKDAYESREMIAKTYKLHVEEAEKAKNVSGNLNQLEFDRLQLEAAEMEIERVLALCNYYVAYQRLLNTVGVNELDEQTAQAFAIQIAEAEAKAKGLTEREEQALAVAQERMAEGALALQFNGVPIHQNTMSDERRAKLDSLIPAESVEDQAF